MARTLLVHRRDGNVAPEVAFQTRSPRHHEKSESLKWDHREVDPVTGSFQNHGDPIQVAGKATSNWADRGTGNIHEALKVCEDSQNRMETFFVVALWLA